MAASTAAQVAEMLKRVGFPNPAIPAASLYLHVVMVAVCTAESGRRADVVNSIGCVGWFQINAPVHKKYDARRLKEPEYNTQAALDIYKSQGLRAWEAYTNGAYKKFVDEARRGVAQASSVVGSADSGSATTTSGGQPAVTYGPLSSEIVKAGVGVPLVAAGETMSPLSPLKIFGTEIWADYSTLIVGKPMFEAGIETIPNVKFSIADPEGDLLFRHRNVFVRGARVQYLDLNLRLDTLTFEPGPAGNGQISITAIDDIVFGLMRLQGPATASSWSAPQWLHQEMFLAGLSPSKYLLGEATVTQSQIARDVPDQQGTAGGGQQPSGWTTIVRLAKELGKRVFISGNRIVFGSSQFAMRWTAPGAIQLSRHALGEGEKWLSLPTAKLVTIGSRSDVLEVTGRVPLNRALFFRPGVPVAVRNTPGIAGDEFVTLMCSKVSFGIGTDVDGADITLLAPVDPPAEPPQSTSANAGSTTSGASVSGGGADGQVDRFVALALQQAGDRYVFGAEAKPSDPDPRQFDCCLTIDSMISTSSRGPLPIAEVEEGDTVWCWDNGHLAERKVIAVAEQPVQPVFAVRTRNSTVRASANHPFLTLRRAVRERDERGGWKPVRWHSEWVRLDQLAKGDLLVKLGKSPQSREPVLLASGIVVDTAVAWLLGEIIGDGHVHNGGVSIAAFRPEVRAKIRVVAGARWGARAADHETHGVIIPSVRLRDDLIALNMRVPGPKKRVPDQLRVLGKLELRALLSGYAEADGHLDKRGHQSYSSCSRRLIDDVRALHQSLGDRVSNITTTQRKRPIIIKGKLVKNARDLHSFTTYPESPRRNTTVLNVYGARRALPDEMFTVERVVSVEAVGEEPTFDLEIDGAHNYIADSLVVHNSELVEWAAAQAGISPRVPDGSAAQKAHCQKHGTMLSVSAGINTKGALLFSPGHVAISLGNGKTIEAMNPSAGVKQGNAAGRFKEAGKIPGAKGYR